MVTTGLSLALLTGCGFYVVFQKLPKSVKRFMQKHVLLTDAVACLLTYMLFGSTLVALFAAAWLGLITSTILALTANPVTNEILEGFMDRIRQMKNKFMDWASKHVAQKQTGQTTLKVV